MEKDRHSKKTVILGSVIFAFAVIGLISVIVFTVNRIKAASSAAQDADYSAYDSLITPAAAVDPDLFDSIADADPADLIDISIRSIIGGGVTPDEYTYTQDALLIPQADVEKRFTKLFGDSTKPVHQTVDGYGYEFSYDSMQQVYSIPLTSLPAVYTPRITLVKTEGTFVTITVGLVNASYWQQDTSGNISPAEPDKYEKFVYRRSGADLILTAVKAAS